MTIGEFLWGASRMGWGSGLVALAVSGCGGPPSSAPVAGVLHTSAALEPAVAAFLVDLPGDWSVAVSEVPTRVGAAASADGRVHIAVVSLEDGCAGCFEVDGGGTAYTVEGGDLLGAQYGLAHLMERWGYRFFHPFDTHHPDALADLAGDPTFGVHHTPEVPERGLHLHTLHPIEGLDAVWTPGAENVRRAGQIADWVVKNRGNYWQWVALANITNDPVAAQEWADHTRRVNEQAHLRGLRTGLGIQLFGSGNLQLAFDLVDNPEPLDRGEAELAERLTLVAGGLGFDRFNLSFGEFFGEDPDVFIAWVNRAWGALQDQQPGAQMSTVIHVGDSDDQKVVYDDQEMIYYFLATYADPQIVPWVHSVMYYDLFEDAGGAYHHEEFDAHRELLLSRMSAGQPVGYFPETAYWVAFDNPVPVYLPLYVRTRWLDLDRIRAQTGDLSALSSHVLFSSGWEWGYWQGDYAALRASYAVGDDWADSFAEMYAPWGDDGAALADVCVTLAALQAGYLIEDRLAAYIAGRDAVMDVGYKIGIVSQPERPTFADVVAMEDAERVAFSADVVAPLGAFASATRALVSPARALADAQGDRWFVEVADGVEVDAYRVEFAAAVWGAAAGAAGGDDVTALVDAADSALAGARAVVGARHGSLHDPLGQTWLTDPYDNPTVYPYGYLARADELCFWERELAELRAELDGAGETAPGCAF